MNISHTYSIYFRDYTYIKSVHTYINTYIHTLTSNYFFIFKVCKILWRSKNEWRRSFRSFKDCLVAYKRSCMSCSMRTVMHWVVGVQWKPIFNLWNSKCKSKSLYLNTYIHRVYIEYTYIHTYVYRVYIHTYHSH